MKKSFFFLLLALPSLACAQTNWNPFPQGQITYWNQGATIPVDMYYCDSSYTDGLGRMVQLNASRYYRDLLSVCPDSAYPQLLTLQATSGYPVWDSFNYYLPNIPLADTFVFQGDTVVYQQGQRQVLFFPNAGAGFSWTQYTNTSLVDSVVWTCTNVDTATFFGFADSTKTYTATPFFNGQALASYELKLSKQAGFQQYIPLSYAWDTLPVPVWQTRGFQHRNAGVFGFTSTNFDFARRPCAVGDVFVYSGWCIPHRCYSMDSVVAYNETPDSLYYVVYQRPANTYDTVMLTRQHFTESWRFAHRSVSIDSAFSPHNHIYQLSASNDIALNIKGNGWVYFDTTICQAYGIVVRSPSGVIVDKGDNVVFQEGLGEIFNSALSARQLIGWRKCGQVFGDVHYDSLRTVSVQKLSNDAASSLFKLYPNPAQNTLTLDFSEILATEPIRISIYNLLGQVLQSFETAQTHYQCDIQHLAAGTYIVQIEHSTYRGQQRFVKY